MTREREPVQEIDLHAYADGLLDADIVRKQEVEKYIAEHPEAASFVADIRAQNESIRQLYGSFPDSPVPEHLTAVLQEGPRHPQRRRALQAAVVAGLVAVSTVGGWLIGKSDKDEQWVLDEFVERAAMVHEASSGGLASAIANGEAGLQPLGWLNQRIALELAAPDLAAEGFSLVAKDRLGPEDDPVVRLVYRRADDITINLFLRPRWEEAGSGIASSEAGNVTVLHWLDGPLAFAMTTDAAGPETGYLARVVREAIGRARLKDGAPAMALTPEGPVPSANGIEGDLKVIPGLHPAPGPQGNDNSQLQVN